MIKNIYQIKYSLYLEFVCHYPQYLEKKLRIKRYKIKWYQTVKKSRVRFVEQSCEQQLLLWFPQYTLVIYFHGGLLFLTIQLEVCLTIKKMVNMLFNATLYLNTNLEKNNPAELFKSFSRTLQLKRK